MAAFDAYFCQSGGNDANNGFDNVGVGLATGTWTEATLTLTQAGHGYTFAQGDVIHLSAGTGLTAGLYEPVSSTANTITFAAVSSLPGVGDGNDIAAGDDATGDWTSSDGPFLTIQKILANVTSGKTGWVRSDQTYNEALTIIGGRIGTVTAPNIMEGYTTDIGDEGIATNDGTTGALVTGMDPQPGNNYFIFRNLHFTNFSGTGFGDLAVDVLSAYKVRASSCGIGFQADAGYEFLNCTADNNTGDGFQLNGFGNLWNCISQNNGGDGVQFTAGANLIECLIYENTGDAVNWLSATGFGIFVNNTIVAATASGNTGLSISPANTGVKYLCVNNTVSGYSGGGGKGIETAVIGERAMVYGNNVYDCETAYSGCKDLGAGTTGDPSFVNAGADDYTPDVDSPLIAAGLEVSTNPAAPTLTTQGATVGCLLRAVVASGGGLLMPNKRAGKQ